MKLSKTVFDASTPSAAHIAGAVGTITHESRHAEQWFRMARLEAHHGKNADEIARRMRIPITVAQAAKNNPLRPDTVEGREAEAWHESVYGSKAAERNKILSDRRDTKQVWLNAKAENERVKASATASAAEKESAQRKETETLATYRAAWEKYRALPEEADAAKVGDAVESAVKAP